MTDVTITPADGFPIELTLIGSDGTAVSTHEFPDVQTIHMAPDLTLIIKESEPPTGDTHTGVKITTGPNGEDAAVVELLRADDTVLIRWITMPDSEEQPALMPRHAMRITLAQGDTP